MKARKNKHLFYFMPIKLENVSLLYYKPNNINAVFTTIKIDLISCLLLLQKNIDGTISYPYNSKHSA